MLIPLVRVAAAATSFAAVLCTALPSASAPHVWVGTDRGVIAIDVETDAVATAIHTPTPAFVEAAPGTRHAFAVGATKTLLIDTRALAPTAEMPAFSSFVLNPARGEAYVQFPSLFPAPQAHSVFSTATFGTGGTLPATAGPVVAIDTRAGRGYFASFDGVAHSVVEVDLATRVQLRRFAVPGHARFGDVDPVRGRLYVPVGSPADSGTGPPPPPGFVTAVVVFDLAIGQQVGSVGMPVSSILAARLNPAGTRLYVLGGGSPATIWAIDTASLQTVGEIQDVGSGGAVAMDIAPAGDKLYVVNTFGVAVFDAGLRAGRTIVTGSGFQARFRFIGGEGVTDAPPGPATGLWWNPAEPGWGLHLTQRRSTFFAALFHYDASGKARWLVAPSCKMNTPCPDCVEGVICHGAIFETNASAFFFGPFNPAAVGTRETGIMEIRLVNRDRAHLTYVVGGAHRSVAIERQVYAPRIAQGTDYTDLWWNPRESGWGLGITHQSNVMFLTWFVYDESGRPAWYVASNCAVVAGGNGCRGALYRTSGPRGPVPGESGFDRGALNVVEVGSIEVNFQGQNDGIMSYTVDGRSGSRTITRQLF